MPATINPDVSYIYDEAEVWILAKAALNGAAIEGSAFEPTSVDDDLEALGWGYVGLIDASKGIPWTPGGEVKKFDAFGYAAYRSKFVKGTLETGFACLEKNAVTAGIILPGSAPGKIGLPKDLQYYVLYIARDVGLSDEALMSLRPALLEFKEDSGIVEGEQRMYEFVVHHSPDSNKDVFMEISNAGVTAFVATITGGPTGGTFTLTYRGQTTQPIANNASAATVKAALVALDDGYTASDFTVSGSAGGPYTIAVPVAAALTATGSFTGGTSPAIAVAAA